MTSAEIENRIARVNATMAMEDMPLTEDEKNTMRDILQGKTSYEEVREQLIKKYTKAG
ncbi:MAG: antitoxin VbhA family protein [Acutalibacteraceae bacterium]|nr:antitoxin VbhA family protein [Acutalibacteraceae bacterium]